MINDLFFMDTLFATREARKSFCVNNLCQLFATDKGIHICCTNEIQEGGNMRCQTVYK